MKGDCPVKQCSLHNSKPTTLYSSALKGPTPAIPSLDKLKVMDGPRLQDKSFGDAYNFQHTSTTPSRHTDTNVGKGLFDPMEGSGLVQSIPDHSPLYPTMIADVTSSAADQVAIYRGWLKGQMDAQKARIMAMSEQFSIPVPNLELNPFEAPPLSLMTPSMGNAVAGTTNKTMIPKESKKKYVFDERDEPSAPPAPRKPSVLPVLGLWKPEAQDSPRAARTIAPGPLSARAPMPPRPSPLDQGPNPGTPTVVVSERPQASNAPKKGDMAYKTTPCRHYTLSQGWCPYGDECGL